MPHKEEYKDRQPSTKMRILMIDKFNHRNEYL